MTADHDLTAAELAVLQEACRAKDRCDVLAGVQDSHRLHAATAATMNKLIAALRLPDPVTGKRPRYRGPRGVYRPRG